MLLSELDDPDQTAVEVISLEHISAAEAVHIAGQLKQLQKQELSLVEDDLNTVSYTHLTLPTTSRV